MDLGKVKIHPIKASFVVYLPQSWVKHMELKKGNEVVWFIDEEDFKTLKLKKVSK